MTSRSWKLPKPQAAVQFMGDARGHIWAAALRVPTNLIAGLMLMAFGGLGIMTTRDLPFGSSSAMGPGYFPLIVSGLIVMLGAIVAASSIIFRQVAPSPEIEGATPWRAMVLITLAVIGFALFIEDVGLFFAGYGLILMTSLAAPQFRLIEVIVFPPLLSAAVTGIFCWGLGLNLPVWPTWI